MENKFLEEDLYKPVFNFLVKQGYEVRSEVNSCDICALKDDLLTVVELKKNLSVDLLIQGVKRQKIADFVYIAVPKPKRLSHSKWKDISYLIKRLELGLIFVSLKGSGIIEVPIEPAPFDFQKSKQQNRKRRDRLLNEMKGRSIDLNTGGSKGKKLITAYKENSIHIACCLDMFGPMSAKKLRSYGTDNKKTWDILYNNFYGWFTKLEDRTYGITEAGKQGIQSHVELSDHYRNKILNFINTDSNNPEAKS